MKSVFNGISLRCVTSPCICISLLYGSRSKRAPVYLCSSAGIRFIYLRLRLRLQKPDSYIKSLLHHNKGYYKDLKQKKKEPERIKLVKGIDQSFATFLVQQ